MTPTETQFLTDADGRRVAALVGLDRYEQLLDALEELEAIRAYDAAKGADDEVVPLEEAVRDIERGRYR